MENNVNSTRLRLLLPLVLERSSSWGWKLFRREISQGQMLKMKVIVQTLFLHKRNQNTKKPWKCYFEDPDFMNFSPCFSILQTVWLPKRYFQRCLDERYTRVSNFYEILLQMFPRLLTEQRVKFNNFSVLNIENWYWENYDQRINMFL